MLEILDFLNQAPERQICRECRVDTARTLSPPSVRGVFWNRQFQPYRIFLTNSTHRLAIPQACGTAHKNCPKSPEIRKTTQKKSERIPTRVGPPQKIEGKIQTFISPFFFFGPQPEVGIFLFVVIFLFPLHSGVLCSVPASGSANIDCPSVFFMKAHQS